MSFELTIILRLGESSFARELRQKLDASRENKYMKAEKSGSSWENFDCEGKSGVSW